jgi:hypothetical protein
MANIWPSGFLVMVTATSGCSISPPNKGLPQSGLAAVFLQEIFMATRIKCPRHQLQPNQVLGRESFDGGAKLLNKWNFRGHALTTYALAPGIRLQAVSRVRGRPGNRRIWVDLSNVGVIPPDGSHGG